MSDRFRILYQLNPDGYCAGAPVLIVGGNLLWDNVSSRPLVQIKFQSLCPYVIDSVRVHVDLMNKAGELTASTDYSYDDLDVARNQYFGEQDLIRLNDTSIAAFSVRVVDATLYDGTVLAAYSEHVSYLPQQLPLRTALNNDAELEKQFRIDNGKTCKYAACVVDDLWLCSCGAINNANEDVCYSCGIQSDTVLYPDLTGLEERKNIRLHQVAKTKKKIKRESKKAAVVAVALVVAAAMIAAILYYMIIPAARYKKAESYFSSGDYRAALEQYKKSGSFRNSEKRAADARQKIWENEYEAILTEGYLDSFSAEDMQSPDTVFGLAYIDGDDIPELIVSPYSYYCYIFSIYEDEDYLGYPEIVNTVLTFDSDDYNEIGYYEKNSYVYSKHGSDDGVAFGSEYELWTPLDENEALDDTEFETKTDKYSIFGDSGVTVDYIITRDGSYSYYDEVEFYNELHLYVDSDAYKAFELWRNTTENRSNVLNTGKVAV